VQVRARRIGVHENDAFAELSKIDGEILGNKALSHATASATDDH
jgi:hypothetical protein